MRERKGDFIATFSGRAFWPFDPRPEDVVIEDIAHALSMLCRFGGHTQRFYSVSEHSIHISRRVPPADALWGLLHDASEAYLLDLPRPIKVHIPEYRKIEARVMDCIAERFHLEPDEPVSVQRMDRDIIHDEREQLMPLMKHMPWVWGGKPHNIIIRGWTPAAAERNFLARFHTLMRLRSEQKEAA